MALPPERINVKRRRQDEPIDTLILEQGLARDKKRRFTDFYFQRLHRDAPADSALKLQGSTTVPVQAVRNYQHLGIPLIRSTTPGDEVRDFARYKAAQKDSLDKTESSLLRAKSAKSSQSQEPHLARRRFHLTRDLSSIQSGQTARGGRPKFDLRPPLATFIERRDAQSGREQSIYNSPPVDRIVELNEEASVDKNNQPLLEASINRKTQIGTFLKSPRSAAKRGVSIRDDPTTWDQDSDQLANELAALAFDIDPADAAEPPQVEVESLQATTIVAGSHQPPHELMDLDNDDDFVFETYIRVKHDSDTTILPAQHDTEVGVLVIDDENEDLWEKYVHGDDDDDEWDEEDEDSNAEDNPRNEYPEDEVSTDDEYGNNVYKHRRNASGDEEFDEERDDW